MKTNSSYIIGVDIGGTFTDCVVLDEDGNRTVGKALSTPDDFSVGVIDAIRDAANNLGLPNESELIQSTKIFFHACTVGDNALITRAGAKTGLITTKGFADTLLMMRGKTWQGLSETDAAHLSANCKPDPLVPRTLIEEVTERIDYKGSVMIKLNEEEVAAALDKLLAKGIESLAVCFLWSISNPSHEHAVAEIVANANRSLFVSSSCDVAPYQGEYERTATTVINAYIGPKISDYLHNLQGALRSRGLTSEPLIMQAYGGVLGIEATCRCAVGTIESGPAAGVLGTQALGELIGEPNILATDMGGTTFKMSVVRENSIEKDYNPIIVRHSVLSSKIWVESIGAGGGSIAWIDSQSGLLKVGPQGAGAKPGPVCYGLGGTEPTVSDANLVLGYLNENYFLGGRMNLDKTRAAAAIRDKIAQPLGIDEVEAASGIYLITNSHMSDLIRKATVERGYDPRSAVLFAYGGAGPIHASRYAAELGVQQVIIPLTASVHGANGLVSSNVVYEFGKSDKMSVPASVKRVNDNFSVLAQKALKELTAAGFNADDVTLMLSVDMRYRNQIHEVNVPFPPGTSEISDHDLEELYSRFDTVYETLYGKGSAYREAGQEIITFRLTGVGKLTKPKIRRESLASKDPGSAFNGKRDVYFDENKKFVPTNVYRLERMQPGCEILGPAIIESPVTTIVVNPKDRAMMDEFKNLRITVGL